MGSKNLEAWTIKHGYSFPLSHYVTSETNIHYVYLIKKKKTFKIYISINKDVSFI